MRQILAALKHREAQSPQACVMVDKPGEYTAGDLSSRVEALQQFLKQEQSRNVALLADNGANWVCVDIAVQSAGLCIIPVPTFFTSAQLDYLLDEAQVDTLIVDSASKALLSPGVRSKLKELDLCPGFSIARFERNRLAQYPPQTSKVTFTSGSTGSPKGVCLSSAHCENVALSLAQATEVSQPRHLCVLPLSILLENIGGVYMPLLAGGCSIAPPLAELGFNGSSELDVDKFLSCIDHYKPSTLILVPQFLQVLDHALSQGWRPPSSLEFVAVGGARMPPALLERVVSKGIPVFEGYGLSECASVVALSTVKGNRRGTCGRALDHVQVVSRNGELEISGSAFLGYLNQPNTWGQTKIQSGDMGGIDKDGYVTITGRRSNLIITSYGRNVSPEWVESELMDAAVFRQLVVLGDGRPSLVALVFPVDTDCQESLIDDAIDKANLQLPDYAQVKHWMQMDEAMTAHNGFLTSTGKPRRAEIFEHYESRIDRLYINQQELLVS